MTRDIDWGIAVPRRVAGEPDQEALRGFDAVIGYLSASIEWAAPIGRLGPLAGVVERPDALSYYFMGRTTSPSTARSGRPSCWPTGGKGANGRHPAARRAQPAHRGRQLGVPDDGGKQFSSSAGRDLRATSSAATSPTRSRYFFVAAAGPESQDADFTWSEFVRRTNDELVAGWGNLVNRTANLIAKNFGEIPKAGELTADDQALLDRVGSTFDTVGDLIARHRQKQAIGEAMRTVADVNKYVSDTEPWKIKEDPERLGTILHVVAQCVADLNLVLSPFLPFAANEVDKALGGAGEVAPMPRIEEVDDLDGGRRTRSSPVSTPVSPGGSAGRSCRHAGRQTDADLHQARPVRGRRGARAAGRVSARAGG